MCTDRGSSLAVVWVRTLPQRLSALTFLAVLRYFLSEGMGRVLCREGDAITHCQQGQVRGFYEQLKAEGVGKIRVSVACLGARNHGWKKRNYVSPCDLISPVLCH